MSSADLPPDPHPNSTPPTPTPLSIDHHPTLTVAPSRHCTNKVILTMSGKQCAEALPFVMRLLATDPQAVLTDFAQFAVRDRFLATALLRTPHPQQTVKDVLYKAHQHTLHDVSFHVEYAYPPFASHPSAASLQSMPPSSDELLLTMYSPVRVPLQFLATVAATLQKHHARILHIDRLTDDADAFMCFQFRIAVPYHAYDASPVLEDVQRALFNLGRDHPACDLALQRADVMRNAKRIVVFDLSWTLIQCDAVNVVLSAAGLESPPPALVARFNAGEMSRVDYLHARVALLAGLDARRVYARTVSTLKYTAGADVLCQGLRRHGCRLAVMTSGCNFVCEAAKDELGLDFAFGNDFEVDSAGKFTGNVTDPVVDAERKRELLQMLAMQERVTTDQIVAVGDGPVSSQMLASAGMSIAFDQPGATDNVQNGHISTRSLASVLYLLGVAGHGNI